MTHAIEAEIIATLKSVKLPDSDHNIIDAGIATGLVVKDGHVQFALEIDPSMAEKMEPVRKQAEQAFSCGSCAEITIFLRSGRCKCS